MPSNSPHDNDSDNSERNEEDPTTQGGPTRRERRRRGNGPSGLPDMNEVQVNLPAESQPGGAVFR